MLAYLSRYTHRVAISNRRLISLDERGVTFRYKDYRRDGAVRYRTMTLATDEFIRRFLLHVLPKGFHRMRHYGLLASAGRKANVARARALLAVPPVVEQAEPVELTEPRPPCPCCGGRMIIIETFQRGMQPRAPPVLSRTNRDDDAVTRHGSYPRRVVALLHRPSAHRGPSGSSASLGDTIPDAITNFASPWPRITAQIARQDCRNGDREQAGEHHTRFPQHNQILKSP